MKVLYQLVDQLNITDTKEQRSKLRRDFINSCYNEYKVCDIYSLLQKVTYKTQIKNFPCYNVFISNVNNGVETFDINNLSTKHRLICYFLAIFYGYKWEKQNACYHEAGIRHIRSVEFKHGEKYELKYLKKYKVYSPVYFDCVDEIKQLYSIKDNMYIYDKLKFITHSTLSFTKD